MKSHRAYNKWNLELKWWLQENGIWDWVAENGQGVFLILLGLGLLAMTIYSYIYFLRVGE
jgi:hypothetical protein